MKKLKVVKNPREIYNFVEKVYCQFGKVFFFSTCNTKKGNFSIKISSARKEDLEFFHENLFRNDNPYFVTVIDIFLHFVPQDERWSNAYIYEVWTVSEFCLSSILQYRSYFKMSEDEIRVVCKKILLALDFYHKKGKKLQVLKASHVMITEKGEIKLRIRPSLKIEMPCFSGPIGDPYWMRADIWSLGIVTIEMTQGVTPYNLVHPMRTIFLIPRNGCGLAHPDLWSSELRDFLERILVINPDNRWTIDRLLKHPFITQTHLGKKINNLRSRKKFCDIIIHLNQNSKVQTGSREKIFDDENSRKILLEMVRKIKRIPVREYRKGRENEVVHNSLILKSPPSSYSDYSNTSDSDTNSSISDESQLEQWIKSENLDLII